VLGYSAIKFGLSSVVLAVAVTVAAIVGQGAVVNAAFRTLGAAGMTLIGAGALVLTQVSVGAATSRPSFSGCSSAGSGSALRL
jgi:hypothetical protein